jgi:hypothetical protein
MADYGIPIGKLFVVGLVSVLLTVDLIIGLQALYYWQLNRDEASASLDQSPKLQALLNAQRTHLDEYRLVDAEKGIATIPISKAMELVVAELLQKNEPTPPKEKTQSE